MPTGNSATSQVRVLPRAYSPGEEVASAVSHGVGTALGVVALVLLVVRAAGHGDVQSVVAVSVYGVTLIVLYLASTLYHALKSPRAKQAYKVLDHCAIYLLIAGTYTAYSLSVLRGRLGWALFGVIWTCAAVGVAAEATNRNRNKLLSTALYVVMGWLVVFVAGPVKAAMSTTSFALLVWGGGAYTVGAIVYAQKRVAWTHPVWHLFVLAGSTLHFFSIWGSL
jgi:hemolysin III